MPCKRQFNSNNPGKQQRMLVKKRSISRNEKKETRLAKENTKRQQKAEKDRQKKKEKEERKQRQAEEKAKKAKTQTQTDADANDDDGEDRKTTTRRGKGLNELGEGDYPVLVSKFPGREVCVSKEEDHDSFLAAVVEGLPAVWRLKRSVVKKVLQLIPDINTKELRHCNNIFKSATDAFISDFAEKVEAVWLNMRASVR